MRDFSGLGELTNCGKKKKTENIVTRSARLSLRLKINTLKIDFLDLPHPIESSVEDG